MNRYFAGVAIAILRRSVFDGTSPDRALQGASGALQGSCKVGGLIFDRLAVSSKNGDHCRNIRPSAAFVGDCGEKDFPCCEPLLVEPLMRDDIKGTAALLPG